MAQLIVRKLEAKLVNRLKVRAKEHGVSMEEEARRILKAALPPSQRKPKMSFGEYLVSGPPWSDEFCDILDKIVKSRR